jgi:hypothetical protein
VGGSDNLQAAIDTEMMHFFKRYISKVYSFLMEGFSGQLSPVT